MAHCMADCDRLASSIQARTSYRCRPERPFRFLPGHGVLVGKIVFVRGISSKWDHMREKLLQVLSKGVSAWCPASATHALEICHNAQFLRRLGTTLSAPDRRLHSSLVGSRIMCTEDLLVLEQELTFPYSREPGCITSEWTEQKTNVNTSICTYQAGRVLLRQSQLYGNLKPLKPPAAADTRKEVLIVQGSRFFEAERHVSRL